MSKEIDFSKAPEGATHYYPENEFAHFAWAKYLDGKIYILVPCRGGLWEWYSDFCGDHPIEIPSKWTIYNNTKPLKDLTDEQAARLFNAWRGGEQVELSIHGKEFSRASNPSWVLSCAYRIKPKSERELFVEAAESMSCSSGIAAQMFDSGKFKLVKD